MQIKMRALELNDYGVSEINQNEMLEIDGGFLRLCCMINL
jgi:hypothetical protein